MLNQEHLSGVELYLVVSRIRVDQSASGVVSHAGSLVTAAIQRAAQESELEPEAIFHTDRGSNYTSADFHTALKKLDLRHSVGRTGICYDNAMAESFFAALKNELVHCTVYPTRRNAIRDITKFIDGRYNSRRLHSGLGYQTPNEVHDAYKKASSAAWKYRDHRPRNAGQIKWPGRTSRGCRRSRRVR